MKKPNFLVIVADDMGFSDAGCNGGEISTPNLDALAAGGLRFTQHYSAGRCWPSRACIMTGNYYQQVLKAMGQWENTITLFISDNGASAEQIIRGDGHNKRAKPGSGESYLCLGPGWSTAANTPFRYHKSWVHEGGIASPLIVHWPRGIRAKGELRHAPSHFVDIVPTLLDLAGQKKPPSWRGKDTPPLAGVSLKQAFREDVDIERDCIFFRHIGHRALRVGKWKLVAVHHGKWELYDMAADRSELNNLAKKHPARVARMAALWEDGHRKFVEQSGTVRD